MKKLLVGALALLALTACNQDNKSEALQQEAMQFGSNIPALNLRMANNAFEANDAIGISMTGDATATNVEYKTTAGGLRTSRYWAHLCRGADGQLRQLLSLQC